MSEPHYVLLRNCSCEIFVDESGVIRRLHKGSRCAECHDDGLQHLFSKYNCKYRGSVAEYYDVIVKYVDKPLRELEKHLEKRYERQRKREMQPTQREALDKHRNMFGGMIIGVDKRGIDVFDAGVRVALLFSTQYSYSEQIEYLKSNLQKCANYVIEQAKNSRRLKGRPILQFCDLVEVTMTRRNEAHFLFEIKDGIKAVLES